MTLLLYKLVRVCSAIHVMIYDASHLAREVTLLPVQHIMINQGHLFNLLSGVRELRSELIVEIQIVLTDLAIFKMFCYL